MLVAERRRRAEQAFCTGCEPPPGQRRNGGSMVELWWNYGGIITPLRGVYIRGVITSLRGVIAPLRGDITPPITPPEGVITSP